VTHGTDDRRPNGVTETAPGGAAPAFEVRPFEVRSGVPMVNVIAAASVSLAVLIALVGTGTLSATPHQRASAAPLAPVAQAALIVRPLSHQVSLAGKRARVRATAKRHRAVRVRAAHRRAAKRRAARHRAAARRRAASRRAAAAARGATPSASTGSSPATSGASATTAGSGSASTPSSSGGSSHSGGGGSGGSPSSSGGQCREYALC
jgi:uncharacterized membrane protein YgcG